MDCCHTSVVPVLHEAVDPVSGELFSAVRCQACGLVVTRPLPEDLSVFYPEEGYHAYSPARASLTERARQGIAARIVYRPIWQRPPGRLLDVGCGSGRLASAFLARGWEVHGVEPSPEACRLAEQRGVRIDGHHIGDADGTFDAIVFNHSLEHIPEPGGALAHAVGQLRDGGLLGVAVPNFDSWHRRLFGRRWLQLDLPRHVSHFDRGSLIRLMTSAGLAPVRVLRTPFLPTLTGSLGIRLPGKAQQILNYALMPPQLLLPGDCLNVIARKRDAAV